MGFPDILVDASALMETIDKYNSILEYMLDICEYMG